MKDRKFYRIGESGGMSNQPRKHSARLRAAGIRRESFDVWAFRRGLRRCLHRMSSGFRSFPAPRLGKVQPTGLDVVQTDSTGQPFHLIHGTVYFWNTVNFSEYEAAHVEAVLTSALS